MKIYTQTHTNAWTTWFLACTDEGLCMMDFAHRKQIDRQKQSLLRLSGGHFVKGSHPILSKTIDQLEEYLNASRKIFDIPLHIPATAFQQSVWQSLLSIPYGTTRSYKWLAEEIGDPNASRAVANANGQNRIAIIIPCHRIIGADGQLTGYAGGLPLKKKLLHLEGNTDFLSNGQNPKQLGLF